MRTIAHFLCDVYKLLVVHGHVLTLAPFTQRNIRAVKNRSNATRPSVRGYTTWLCRVAAAGALTQESNYSGI